MQFDLCPRCGRPMIEASSADGPPQCHHCPPPGDRDIALAAARRKAARLTSLYPRHPFRASGYAAGGKEIEAPFVGGPPTGWSPPPGSEYARADVDGDQERVYVLRQPAGLPADR